MTAPTPAGDGIGGLCDRLEEARKAATGGPWDTDDGLISGPEAPRNTEHWIASGIAEHDAALIVAAVNGLPALIAAARERDRLLADMLGLAEELDLAAHDEEATRAVAMWEIADRLRAVAAAAGEAT